jgi:hypothetical protein
MQSEREIVVESAQPLSPHGKAVYETGVALLRDSIETGREFCKSMIATSFAAVPVYVAVITLFVPDNKTVPDLAGAVWLLPMGLFLAAAGAFTAGYLPGRAHMSLDLPDQVEEVVGRAINRRYWLGLVGFLLLSTGIIVSVVVLGTLDVQRNLQ